VTFAATAAYRLASLAVESAYFEPVCSLLCKCGCC
jgi:hypothetical protein